MGMTELTENCKVQVRISDNVLSEEDWPIADVEIKDGRIVSFEQVKDGVYGFPPMEGQTLDWLIYWSNYDATGKHPEIYQDILVDGMVIHAMTDEMKRDEEIF